MSSVQNIQTNIPKNSYLVPDKWHGEAGKSEDQIIKKTPLLGAQIAADKFTKSVFHYAPKGLSGSKNSNFYEFLSMGAIPNLAGSAAMIALFNAANKGYNPKDKFFAGLNGRKMATGVVFYAVGKWLSNQLINKGVQAQTGVDLDTRYKKVVHRLPEHAGDKNLTGVEYHRVFESVDFPYWKLLEDQGEKQGNKYAWYDKIAKKMGYKEEQDAPNQLVQPKVVEVATKANAAKSLSFPLWSALGVAFAVQEPFEKKAVFPAAGTMAQRIKGYAKNVGEKFVEAGKQLYNGNGKGFNKLSKYAGRTLIFGALASSVLGVLNATSNFKAKTKPETTIDKSKEYEVHK